MAYTVNDFRSKKVLKEQVELYNVFPETTTAVLCYQPGLGPDLANFTGKVRLEGPHYPAAHTWYAEAELVNGVVVKVK